MEEEHVDVRERADLVAPVAAERHERGTIRALQSEVRAGRLEEPREEHVHHPGAPPGERRPALARAVLEAQAMVLHLEEASQRIERRAVRETHRGGLRRRAKNALGVGADLGEVGGHRGRSLFEPPNSGDAILQAP